MSDNGRARLAHLFRVLSTEPRIGALEFIGKGKSLEEIAELIGMTRTGFQRVLNDFHSLDLIEEAGHRSYRRLSPKGKRILELIGELSTRVRNIETGYQVTRLSTEIERAAPSLSAPTISKLKEVLESAGVESGQSGSAKKESGTTRREKPMNADRPTLAESR